MGVQAIESFEEFNQIIGGGKPVVIDFWATWCGPCRMISPVLESLSEQFPNIGCYKVDVDAQEISQDVGIKAMPTFILYKDGNKINELVGASPQKLQELVAQAAGLV